VARVYRNGSVSSVQTGYIPAAFEENKPPATLSQFSISKRDEGLAPSQRHAAYRGQPTRGGDNCLLG
jgi:hypothetical protein